MTASASNHTSIKIIGRISTTAFIDNHPVVVIDLISKQIKDILLGTPFLNITEFYLILLLAVQLSLDTRHNYCYDLATNTTLGVDESYCRPTLNYRQKLNPSYLHMYNLMDPLSHLIALTGLMILIHQPMVYASLVPNFTDGVPELLINTTSRPLSLSEDQPLVYLQPAEVCNRASTLPLDADSTENVHVVQTSPTQSSAFENDRQVTEAIHKMGSKLDPSVPQQYRDELSALLYKFESIILNFRLLILL